MTTDPYSGQGIFYKKPQPEKEQPKTEPKKDKPAQDNVVPIKKPARAKPKKAAK